MRTLHISISETEFKKFGLKGNTLSFSEFIMLIRSELSSSAHVEDAGVADNYGRFNTVADERVIEENISPTQNRLSFSDFSFSKTRQALENYKGSFSDAVIDERRAEL